MKPCNTNEADAFSRGVDWAVEWFSDTEYASLQSLRSTMAFERDLRARIAEEARQSTTHYNYVERLMSFLGGVRVIVRLHMGHTDTESRRKEKTPVRGHDSPNRGLSKKPTSNLTTN
jgi:hypothetical protein